MTYRAIPAEEVFAKFPKHVREAGEARGRQLVEEYTLQQVRNAVSLTQGEVALAAGTTQDQVSKLERRHDLMISTLEKHVAALGGKLRLAVEFPGQPAVSLSLKGRIVSKPKPSTQGRKSSSRVTA